jgi:hypothetical protein
MSEDASAGRRGRSARAPAPEQAGRPIAELLQDLATESSTLVRQEFDLARVEMLQKARAAGLGAGMLGAAGVLGHAGFGAFTAGAIDALGRRVGPGRAALLVGSVYSGLATGLALSGGKRLRQMGPPVPEQALDSVREDIQWVTTQATSAPR